MSNSYGTHFKITTWGESHGKGVGVVIDGCPSGIEISQEEIQKEMDKRRPGQSQLTTQRQEADKIEILSGVFEGKSTGTPISLMVFNQDQKSKDYDELKDLYRPSHADYTYQAKYGIRDHRGGGRSSARETLGRVAAGAIAKKILREKFGMEIMAYVCQVKEIHYEANLSLLKSEDIEASLVRCPDKTASQQMEAVILKAKKAGDSVGGVIQFLIKNCPPGLGSPVFTRVEGELARAFLSIPATKGFEFGSGFAGTALYGSEHNDIFEAGENGIVTKTNYSGGIQGGITNGMPIYGKIAFKPTATILKPQQTVDNQGRPVTFQARGRHDPCVLPRAVVIVESMAALTMLDLVLENRPLAGTRDS